MRAILPLALTSMALLAAGCGGDDGGGGGGAAAPAVPGDVVTIDMVDVKFKPENQTVKVGQTVKWVNEDTIDHNAVATEGADFKSELYGKGESYEAKITQAGTVKYVCTIHPAMTGTLTVVE